MRYWWVNQNQTFTQEVGGRYLWSPKRRADGARSYFYDTMTYVEPGDLVFSFKDTLIQAVAVDALDAGRTHQGAAEAAGVNRVTVTRWVHHHPGVQAELNRLRVERLENLAAHADAVTARALEVIDQAIAASYVSSAVAWIRLTYASTRASTQSLTPSAPLLTPEAIIDRAAESAAMREPMESLNRIYRASAVEQIHDALAPAD